MFESNLALQIAATRGSNTALDEQALRRPRSPESARALSPQDADLLLSSTTVRSRRRRERSLTTRFEDNNSGQFRMFRIY